MESEIAVQQIGNYTLGRNVDLMFGGGSCHFKSMKDPLSCRSDEMDLLEVAKGFGWRYVDSKRDFDQVRSPSVYVTPFILFYNSKFLWINLYIVYSWCLGYP